MGIAVCAVLLVLAALVVGQAHALSRCRFWCKSCGELFALPWTKLILRQHVNEEWRLTCPRCGHKGWCTARRPGKDGGAK